MAGSGLVTNFVPSQSSLAEKTIVIIVPMFLPFVVGLSLGEGFGNPREIIKGLTKSN